MVNWQYYSHSQITGNGDKYAQTQIFIVIPMITGNGKQSTRHIPGYYTLKIIEFEAIFNFLLIRKFGSWLLAWAWEDVSADEANPYNDENRSRRLGGPLEIRRIWKSESGGRKTKLQGQITNMLKRGLLMGFLGIPNPRE